MALLHQQLNHIHAALGHAVGEFLDGDGFRNDDLADELFFRLVGRMPLQPLHAAAKRRDRSLALFVGAERGYDRQTAAAFLPAAARRLRRWCRSRRAGSAAGARDIILVGLERGPCARPRRQHGVLAETLLRLLFGLELGFKVVFAAPLLIGLARLRSLTLGSLGGLAHGADERFLFRNLALFGFAQPGVIERVDTRLLLFLSQTAQHHAARWLGSRSGCGCRGRGRRWCRDLGRRRAFGGSGRCGDIGFGSRRDAAFHLFHDDRLGAAMAEALAHHALLDAPPFQGQGLARGDAQLLFTSLFRRFGHSKPDYLGVRPVSLPILYVGRLAVAAPFRRGTRPETRETRCARQKRLAFGTGEQGCMYHIWPPQCQIQLR